MFNPEPEIFKEQYSTDENFWEQKTELLTRALISSGEASYSMFRGVSISGAATG